MILACVAPGTARDALLYGATEANKQNSERLSRADKRRRASVVLRAPEYANLKDAEVARLIGISHTAVAKYRRLPLGMPTVDPPSHLVEGKTYWLQYDDGEHGTTVEYSRGLPCYLTSHDDVCNEQTINFPHCVSRRWSAEEFCKVLKAGLGKPWRLVEWHEMDFACINTPEQYRKWIACRRRLFAREREDAIEVDEPENETFHSGVSESLADTFSKMRSASAE